jgi:hypothetical protein
MLVGTRDTARVSARSVASILQRVSSSVTHRDQLICLDLHEHRILTTDQIFELHFSSIQRARARLSKLHELGVVWRSRPRALLGSLPWHYTLDEIGAWIVAEHLGIDRRFVQTGPDPGARRQSAAPTQSVGQQLLHAVVPRRTHGPRATRGRRLAW